jgi:hypothetical protein
MIPMGAGAVAGEHCSLRQPHQLDAEARDLTIDLITS